MKKIYLFAALCLLLAGMKSSAMFVQARRWIAQRISPQTSTAARVVTTTDAKSSEQKRLFSSYDAYKQTNQEKTQTEQPSATKEVLGALSAYVAYLFGYVTPTASSFNKGEQNERLNKKNLGPLHKPVDYNNEINDSYKIP